MKQPRALPLAAQSQFTNVIYVFIDASNLWEAQKAKRKFLDYERIGGYIQKRYNGTAVQIFFYTAYPADGTRKYALDKRHKFFTFLEKGLGFYVRKKVLKRISVLTDHGEVIKEKGNMDVEMTIDALHTINQYNEAVFFTGDSDFLALITYLRNYGKKKVYIFSSKNNVAYELRTGADEYVEILDVEEIWGKPLVRRTDLAKGE